MSIERDNKIVDVLLQDVGRRVLYIPRHVKELHGGDRSHPDVERGKVVSREMRGGNTLWVRFDGDENPKLTPLDCLEWEVPL